MRLFLFRLAGVLVPLVVLSQLALPPFLGDRIESRLTEDGGTAEVKLSAFPAALLLTGRGDKLFVQASRLRFDLDDRRENVFDRLGKFDDVAVSISKSRAGPFEIESFFLDRLSEDRYRVFATLSTSASELGRYASEQLGGGFGGLLAALAASTLGGQDRPIPVQLRTTIDTAGSEPRAVDAYADVARLPAGPLALVVTDALLAQL